MMENKTAGNATVANATVVNAIEVSHLTKKWKDFTLSDISFSLQPGYIMGIVGRNGAGKTTLLSSLSGQISRVKGEVSIYGYSMRTNETEAKEELGYLMESGPFLYKATLKENGEVFGPLYKHWNQERFFELLHQFGLGYLKTVAELSKGMQMKFQLAFALAHYPRVLLMDEPTGGLDPAFRREFLEIIQTEVAQNHMAVLFSTHLTSDLDKVADYIMLIDQGKAKFCLSMEEIRDKYTVIPGSGRDAWIKNPSLEDIMYAFSVKGWTGNE